jgi:hypothetical protein
VGGHFFFCTNICQEVRKSPLEWAHMVNRLGIWWMNSLLLLGYKKDGALTVILKIYFFRDFSVDSATIA